MICLRVIKHLAEGVQVGAAGLDRSLDLGTVGIPFYLSLTQGLIGQRGFNSPMIQAFAHLIFSRGGHRRVICQHQHIQVPEGRMRFTGFGLPGGMGFGGGGTGGQ